MKIINYHFNEETLEYFYQRSLEVKEVSELYSEMSNFITKDYGRIEYYMRNLMAPIVGVDDVRSAVESIREQVNNYE